MQAVSNCAISYLSAEFDPLTCGYVFDSSVLRKYHVQQFFQHIFLYFLVDIVYVQCLAGFLCCHDAINMTT